MTDSRVAQVRREVGAGTARVWEVVTDWPRHGRHLRGTTIEVVGERGVGQRFTAVSSAGRLRVEDPMEVTVWEPPTAGAGRVRLEKRGQMLTGWAEIIVSPLRPDRSELIWREEIGTSGDGVRVPGIATAQRQLSGRLTRLMIGRLAKRLAHEAETDTND